METYTRRCNLVLISSLITCLFFAGCGGGGSSGDLREELSKKIEFELPDYFTLEEVTIGKLLEQDMGEMTMTEFKFTASIKATEPLYDTKLETDFANKIALTKETVSIGDLITIEGSGNVTKSDGSEGVLYIQSFDRELKKSGLPLSQLTRSGFTVMVDGSVEHQAVLNKVKDQSIQKQNQISDQMEVSAAEAKRRFDDKIKAQYDRMSEQAEARREVANEKVRQANELVLAQREKFWELLKTSEAKYDALYGIFNKDLFRLSDFKRDADRWTARLKMPDLLIDRRVELAWTPGRIFVNSSMNSTPPTVEPISPNFIIKSVETDEKNFGRFYAGKELSTSPLLAHYVRMEPVSLLTNFDDAYQKTIKNSVAGRFKPVGDVTIDPMRHIIYDRVVYDMETGAPIGLAFAGDYVINDLENSYLNSLLDLKKSNFRGLTSKQIYYPGRREMVKLDDANTTALKTQYKVVARNGSRVVTLNQGDLYLEDFSQEGLSEGAKRITNLGVFSELPKERRFLGNWFSYTRSGTSTLVRINVNTGEIQELDRADAPLGMLGPILTSSLSYSPAKDFIRIYDHETDQEIRVSRQVSEHPAAKPLQFVYERTKARLNIPLNANIHFVNHSAVLINFETMEVYSLYESVPVSSPINLLSLYSLSPFGRYAALAESGPDIFAVHLVDLTTGKHLQTIPDDTLKRISNHRIRNPSNESILTAWSHPDYLVYLSNIGALSEIGIWAYNIKTGEEKLIYPGFANIKAYEMSPVTDRLLVVESDGQQQLRLNSIALDGTDRRSVALGALNTELPDNFGTRPSKVIYKDTLTSSIGHIYPKNISAYFTNVTNIPGSALEQGNFLTSKEKTQAEIKAQIEAESTVPSGALEIFMSNDYFSPPTPFLREIAAINEAYELVFGEKGKARFKKHLDNLATEHPEFPSYLANNRRASDVPGGMRDAFVEYTELMELYQSLPYPKRGERELNEEELKMVALAVNRPSGETIRGRKGIRQFARWRSILSFPELFDESKVRRYFAKQAVKSYNNTGSWNRIRGDKQPFIDYYVNRMTQSVYNGEHDNTHFILARDEPFHRNSSLKKKVINDWNQTQAAEPMQTTPATTGQGNQTQESTAPSVANGSGSVKPKPDVKEQNKTPKSFVEDAIEEKSEEAVESLKKLLPW